jgi:hypothetical protein
MKGKLAVVLMYKPRGGAPVALATCTEPNLMLEAARLALTELKSRTRAEDPVIDLEQQLEHEKIRQILFALLPVLKREHSLSVN